MHEEIQFKLQQLASGHYLCANLPDNWQSLTEEEQDKFLLNNVWQPLEGYTASEIWDAIDSAAKATQNFLKNLTENTKQLYVLTDGEESDSYHYLTRSEAEQANQTATTCTDGTWSYCPLVFKDNTVSPLDTREKLILHYFTSLDKGDMSGVSLVKEAALTDSELERILHKIDFHYHEEQHHPQ